MSKAFTREDDVPDPIIHRRVTDPLPPGARNYLTPDGARQLRAELDRLVQIDRPQALAFSDPSLAREKTQILDQRIQHLQQSLQSAVVVEIRAGEIDCVRFGATVSV